MRMRFGSLRSKAAGAKAQLETHGADAEGGRLVLSRGGGSLAGVLVWATGRVSWKAIGHGVQPILQFVRPDGALQRIGSGLAVHAGQAQMDLAIRATSGESASLEAPSTNSASYGGAVAKVQLKSPPCE